jgi:hydrogenase nickel incorporation protein HypB
MEDILGANDQLASQNRQLLDEKGVYLVNFMASPGAGKTTTILRTIRDLEGTIRCGVIEGDVASSVDADKVAAAGIPVVQINTGGGCHLDAPMIQGALERLPLDELDLVMVENVGNLICPVGFKLGEHLQIMVASVPEGHDKPYKYPSIFTQVKAVVLNKIDLLPLVDFDLPAYRRLVSGLNAAAPVFPVSATSGDGFQDWSSWLRTRWKSFQADSGQRNEVK